MSEITTRSAQETKEIAAGLARIIQPGMVVSLKGRLGSGKTTFTQGFAKELGIQRAVKSPTYTIVKQYPLDQAELVFNHIDAYRLEEGGADSIDLQSFIDDNTITLIEWAEFVEDYMPETYLVIDIQPLSQDERLIQISINGESETYEQIIKEWTQNLKG